MKIYKGFVYILASKRNGTLYVGVTNDLVRRTAEHKGHVNQGFTSRYNVTNLVYFEPYPDFAQAIAREKQLKKWRRAWKIALIEKDNPRWDDLAESIGVTQEYVQAVIDEYTPLLPDTPNPSPRT